MTYYAPTSTCELIETISVREPEQRTRPLHDRPALTEGLFRLLVADPLSVPREWRTES